ncbi:MAG: ABC transporter permease subunit [Candidatus Lokiarchaeota archaeon]|nr:ABC transporter permease subunit [Candidatus Lokiarchaeota archaeon]
MIFQANPFEQLLAVLAYWDRFLTGFLLTMWMYVWALFLGFLLGLLLALSRQYGHFFIQKIAIIYIEIIRGTPLIAQLFFISFLPNALNFSIDIMIIETNLFNRSFRLLDYPIFVGILTLILNSGAYQAEYLRGSFVSVGTGQLEAARAIGMSRFSSIRHIVLPQALRRVIPSWSNEAAYLPKYTVLVYFIGGVEELFSQADYIQHRTSFPFATYIIVAILFLITITLISKLLDTIHKRTSIPGL